MVEFLAQLPAFLTVHYDLAYPVLFILSFAETLIGIGFFVYGELIFLPAAALAGAGILNIWLVSAALILGGVAGDGVSFWIGREYGAAFLANRKGKWARLAEEKGEAFFEKHGSRAAFLARFMGPLSWVTPFFAGMHGMAYRSFFINNTPGVILGIGQFIVAGYLGGALIGLIPPELRHWGFIALGVLVGAAVAYQIVRAVRGSRKAAE